MDVEGMVLALLKAHRYASFIIVLYSPAVLATLWDVTDRDIDNFTLRILDDWQFTTQKSGKATRREA